MNALFGVAALYMVNGDYAGFQQYLADYAPAAVEDGTAV